MFAPISAVLALLFFASTLPNGIRLAELPAEGNSVEIVAGYTAGRLTGLTETAAAKSLLMAATAAGGRIDFIDEVGRTAVRITIPSWALPMLAERLPAFFQQAAVVQPAGPPQDFRSKVEQEIRNALLGPDRSPAAYATGDAFVLLSSPPPDSLREALAAIPKREPAAASSAVGRLPAERTFRFGSGDAEGAVVFASPIPGVYYKEWYAMLLLDRVIHRIVPLHVQTALPLTVHPYYYRVELKVPAGQFPEPAQQSLLQELERLQFARANARDFAAAKDDALAYLYSNGVKEWYASYDLDARREEGVHWIESLTADDIRIAARDLLIMNRVLASWAAKPRQLSVTAEPLDSGAAKGDDAAGATQTVARPQTALTEETIAFPPHSDPPTSTAPAERLASGISLAASSANAVFVAGGTLTRLDHEFTADDLKPFAQYRADRILVLAPASSIDHARQLWTGFKGASSGEGGPPRGKVSGGDLPALFLLKTILDLNVIEAGLGANVQLRIDAGSGSELQIQANDAQRAQILAWIRDIANKPLPDAYFAWVREAAIHRFQSVQPSLQALVWNRDPQGAVQDLALVSAQQLQDVARIYF